MAFQFINCLQAHEKAALIIMILRKVTKIGLTIIALVFDGLIGNFTTCRLLGADFNFANNFRPYILNPITNLNIYILLDIPHMVKLVRNCIGFFKKFYQSDGAAIEWQYYEQLEMLSRKCDVVTHKLTRKNIEFEKNKMNVSLATQLFSESVARSMEKLQTLPETREMFKDCTTTTNFTRRMNNVFDIFWRIVLKICLKT